tara:strand:- start:373 stop:483 length:111 start_codon:yes stop_codon:yes gene_type:complete
VIEVAQLARARIKMKTAFLNPKNKKKQKQKTKILPT